MATKIFLAPGAPLADYVFDAALLDYNNTNPKLAPQLPTGAVLYANYNANLNANSGQPAIVTGTPGLNNSQLLCAGAESVSYAITHSKAGAFRFTYIPQYDDDPPANQNTVGIQEDASQNNRILLTHSPSGDNFRVTLNDSAGDSIYLAITIGASNLNLQLGVAVEVELNWDSVAGVIRLFVDGALHGTLSPGPWNLAENSAKLYVGAMPTIYETALAAYDDVMLFNAVQHTAAYTPQPFFEFSVNSPSLTVAQSLIKINSVNAPVVSANVPAGSDLKTVTVVDGTPYWWDNSSQQWLVSSGPAESNSYDDVNPDYTKLALDLSTLNRIWYFISDGIAVPTLNSWTESFDTIDSITVQGSMLFVNNTAPATAKVVVSPVDFAEVGEDNVQAVPGLEVEATQAANVWSATVLAGVLCNYKFYVNGSLVKRVQRKFTVDDVNEDGVVPFSTV